MKRLLLLGSLLAVLLVCPEVFAADPGLHIIQTYKVGGDGGWDYLKLDPETHRLFISRSTHVMVIDTESGKTVGDIPDTLGVHGIALVPDLGRGFTSNGREGTVSIFDLKTLKPTSKIQAVGENPDAIMFDPATKRIFTFNGKSHDSTAIDAASGNIVGKIVLGGKPEFAVSDGEGQIFVNIEDKSELLALDPKDLKVKSRWPLAPCESPSGLALDKKNRRLFAGCDNKMMAVVNADTGKVITTVPIADGVDADDFDSDNQFAFASCGEGVLTVVKEDSSDKFSVAQNVKTERGARTMALDPETHRIFLVTAKFGPPPAATTEQPHPRPAILPDTFEVLVVGK
ncbi:MAG: collagen triple helix repeat domain protein [Acidobacteriaceae bacterium]|nr:collagen triple helix repeat domain protein [Acidobacteriaceae bacterium]